MDSKTFPYFSALSVEFDAFIRNVKEKIIEILFLKAWLILRKYNVLSCKKIQFLWKNKFLKISPCIFSSIIRGL